MQEASFGEYPASRCEGRRPCGLTQYTYRGILFVTAMAHVIRDKKKLLNRIRRIRGQVDAVERALESEADCSEILHTIAACRGAINALMTEVLEGHIRFHLVDPDRRPASAEAAAAQELIDVIKHYLR
jgi:FrmR/RcnR family transcriptional regulator, repressor of frmRAB operon